MKLIIINNYDKIFDEVENTKVTFLLWNQEKYDFNLQFQHNCNPHQIQNKFP